MNCSYFCRSYVWKCQILIAIWFFSLKYVCIDNSLAISLVIVWFSQSNLQDFTFLTWLVVANLWSAKKSFVPKKKLSWDFFSVDSAWSQSENIKKLSLIKYRKYMRYLKVSMYNVFCLVGKVAFLWVKVGTKNEKKKSEWFFRKTILIIL